MPADRQDHVDRLEVLILDLLEIGFDQGVFRNTAFVSLTYQTDKHRWTVHGINQRPHWDGTEDE